VKTNAQWVCGKGLWLYFFHFAKCCEYQAGFIEEFLKTIEGAGLVPAKNQLKDAKLLSFLEPLTEELFIG